MIDICDFAVGLSRQLYGRSIASERPGHRLTETWHPLGPVGVVSAFNFPVAVWSWNAALALVCGDPVVWKPSERTPLTALATHGAPRARRRALRRRARRALRARDRRRRPRRPARRRSPRPAALGHRLDRDGQGARAARRRAPRPLAARARRQQRGDRDPERRPRPRRARGAVLRRGHGRPALHEPAAPDRARDDRRRSRRAPRTAYAGVPIGDPRDAGTLVGPLVSARRSTRMQAALDRARADGRRGRRRRRPRARRPLARRLVRRADDRPDAGTVAPSSRDETFAPILYVLDVRRARRGGRAAERRAAGPRLVDLHDRPARGRGVPRRRRVRLRHRERQHRPERRRDRRRLRRREGDRRRPRVGLRLLEGLHAPPDRDRQLHRDLPLAQGIVFDLPS